MKSVLLVVLCLASVPLDLLAGFIVPQLIDVRERVMVRVTPTGLSGTF